MNLYIYNIKGLDKIALLENSDNLHISTKAI